VAPPGGILAVAVLFGAHSLYHWSQRMWSPGRAPVPQGAFLNLTMFTVLVTVSLALWSCSRRRSCDLACAGPEGASAEPAQPRDLSGLPRGLRVHVQHRQLLLSAVLDATVLDDVRRAHVHGHRADGDAFIAVVAGLM